jgi:hypothetical protein
MPLADGSLERQHSSAPTKRNRWATECARLSVAVAFVVLFLFSICQIQFGAPKSIRWDRYTEEKRDAALAAGKTVVVLLYSEYATESEATLRTFDFNSAVTLCKCDNFEPLLLRHRWEGHDINSIWKQVGHSKYPKVVVYSPNKPPVWYDPLALPIADVRIAANRFR